MRLARDRTGRRFTIPAQLAPLVVTAWVIAPFARPDRWVTGFDTIAYSGPNMITSLREIGAGRIPQWNPEVFGGVTHAGNSQAAVFEPLMWLLHGLSAHRALLTIVAIHIGAFALGMWWVLRHSLRLSAWAAALGCSAAVGSGLVMSRSLQFEQIAVVAWVPWVLVGVDLALRPTGARRRLAVLPLALTLLVISGHPQQVYLAVPLGVLWAIGRMLDLRVGWHGVVRLGIGAVLALGLSAAHVLPVVEALGASAIVDERSMDDAAVSTNNAQARRLPATILGDVGQDVHPFTSGSFEAMGFLGAIAGVLALVGALAWLRGPRRWTPLAMAGSVLLGAACSLGPHTPFYRMLFDLPGFSLARVPARWMLLVTVGAAVLAAYGVEHVRVNGLARRDAAGVAAALLGLLMATRWGPLIDVTDAALSWWAIVFIGIPGAAAVVARQPQHRSRVTAGIVIVASAELLVLSANAPARSLYQERPFTELAHPLTDGLGPGRVLALTGEHLGDPARLVHDLRPNTNVIAGVPSIDGYDGGTQVTVRWTRTVAAITDRMDPELTLKAQVSGPVATSVAARLAVRWLLVDTELHDPAVVAPQWMRIRSHGRLTLLENPEWVSSARLLRRSVHPDDDRSLVAQLRSAPGNAIVLSTSSPALSCTGSCGVVPLQVQRPHAASLRVILPEGAPAGVVVIDEQVSEGWSARVDGNPASVETADGMMIGVRVPDGAREVQLTFDAPGLQTGLRVSGASALLLLLMVLLPSDRSRTEQPPGREQRPREFSGS